MSGEDPAHVGATPFGESRGRPLRGYPQPHHCELLIAPSCELLIARCELLIAPRQKKWKEIVFAGAGQNSSFVRSFSWCPKAACIERQQKKAYQQTKRALV